MSTHKIVVGHYANLEDEELTLLDVFTGTQEECESELSNIQVTKVYSDVEVIKVNISEIGV